MKKNTQISGSTTELKCFLKCIECGFIVSKPIFDNARYDFLLDANKKKILRIQVKTSRWKDEEHSAFVFNCYSQHSTSYGNKRMCYSNIDIDYFMTEKNGQYYLYPALNPENTCKEKTLRLLPTKSGQTVNISWAKDFIFEEVIKQLD